MVESSPMILVSEEKAIMNCKSVGVDREMNHSSSEKSQIKFSSQSNAVQKGE